MEVLSNSDGDILSNDDGDLLGPNYNFGKGLYFRNPYKLSIPAIVGMSIADLSIARWYYNHTDNTNFNSDKMQIICDDGDYSAHSFNSNSTVLQRNGSNLFPALNVSHYKIVSFEVIRDFAKLWKNGTETDTTTDRVFNNISSFLMYSGMTGSNYDVLQGYFAIYSRLLSNAEITTLYNNKLGNDPVNRSGLLFEYKFQKAEILDFSVAQDSSDMRVGVRNYGSIVNGHGEIVGLPAGTLQEQVDYANANLFVNFL